MSTLLDIDVQVDCQLDSIPDTACIKQWIIQVLQSEPQCEQPVVKKAGDVPVKHGINLRVVGYAESQQLNGYYRRKDAPTNVLSFPNENKGIDFFPDDMLGFLGDLLLCGPLIESEARQQNKKIVAHWAHLVVHGVLHLLGYDHIEEIDRQIMETKEIKVLQHLGFPNPYYLESES